MAIPGKVVLLGANGAVGRALGPLLSAAGQQYRVVGRSLLGLQVRFNEDPFCEHLQWDIADKTAFDEACEGAGTVVYLVGAPVWKFAEHLSLTERALKAARKAGAERFLLISSNWSYSLPFDAPLRENSARNPETAKGKIRRDQEDRVLAAHVTGTFSTAVLRIADMYGPRIEASYLWSLFQAAKRGTEAQVLGPIDRSHEFVFVPDAAATILQFLKTDAAWEAAGGQAWNLGGAGVTTIEQMAKLVFASERKPVRYTIPGRVKMGFIRAVNPYIREMREMQYLLDTTVLLDDSKLSALLGGLIKTPYAEGVPEALAAVRVQIA